MYPLNLQDSFSKLPWSRSTTGYNTFWNQSINIWLNLNNIKWFEDVSTIHHHYTSHYYVPSWYWNTTQMFTLWKVKNNSNVTSSPDPNPITPSAPISHNPERSHFDRPLPSILSCSYPGASSRIRQRLFCPLCRELVAGAWWELQEKQKGRERGVSTRTRKRHHIISQHEFCFRAVL